MFAIEVSERVDGMGGAEPGFIAYVITTVQLEEVHMALSFFFFFFFDIHFCAPLGTEPYVALRVCRYMWCVIYYVI